MNNSDLKIGTRGSVLALAQTDWALGEMRRLAPARNIERVIIETQGDRDQTSSLASFGGVGVFVAELQSAILDGRVDAAVHSYKDMASRPTDGLKQYFPPREDVCDVLVGCPLDELREGAVVGTGSPRRVAFVVQPGEQRTVGGVAGSPGDALAAQGAAPEGDGEPTLSKNSTRGWMLYANTCAPARPKDRRHLITEVGGILNSDTLDYFVTTTATAYQGFPGDKLKNAKLPPLMLSTPISITPTVLGMLPPRYQLCTMPTTTWVTVRVTPAGVSTDGSEDPVFLNS